MLLRWCRIFFSFSAFQESFNKHITKVLWKQSVKSSHKMPSIFVSQFEKSMMYNIYIKILLHKHKFHTKNVAWEMEIRSFNQV